MAGLPESVRALAEQTPVEDLILAVLRDGMPEMQVKSLISKDQTFPLVMARRMPNLGDEGDTRFTEIATIAVHAFVPDPNGDEDAAILSEACRVVLRDAWLNHKTFPGLGHISTFEMTSAPRRVTDWATATGPVQFADLPTGTWRYEAIYRLEIRKPRLKPYPIPTP